MSGPEEDRDLDRLVAGLPRSVEPERDLWSGIAERIGAPPPSLETRRKKVVVASAVSFLAVAAAVTLLVAGRVKKPAWPWPSPVPSAVAVVNSPPASSGELVPPRAAAHPLENVRERIAYRAAVVALEASLAESRAQLPGEAARRIDESLGVIDHAIEATEQAIAKDPESHELRSQLWDEYQQKIDALTVVVDLVARTS
jgi:hypothetical protein